MKVGRVNSDALGMRAWVSSLGMWVWQCGHGMVKIYSADLAAAVTAFHSNFTKIENNPDFMYLSHSVHIHYVYLSHSVHIVYVYLSTSFKDWSEVSC